ARPRHPRASPSTAAAPDPPLGSSPPWRKLRRLGPKDPTHGATVSTRKPGPDRPTPILRTRSPTITPRAARPSAYPDFSRSPEEMIESHPPDDLEELSSRLHGRYGSIPEPDWAARGAAAPSTRFSGEITDHQIRKTS